MIKEISKRKPFFDEEGNFCFPDDLKFGGELKPPLKPREWWLIVLMTTNKSKITKKKENEIFKNLIGSKPTLYRTRKSLIRKGYL